jgi:hypothetical protein
MNARRGVERLTAVSGVSRGARGAGHAWPGVLAALLLFSASPAAARQEPPDTTRRDTAAATPQEDVLRRLRALTPPRADTALPPPGGDALPPGPPGATVRFEGARPQQRGADATSGIAHDSVMRALLAIPGYTATEYLGERAWFDTDSARLEIQRNAVVVREGQRLSADSTLIYWEHRALACGYGRPVFSGRGVDSPVQSDSLCYDIERGLGFAHGAETTVMEGAEWRVRGNVYFDPGSGAAFGHDAIFTDCDEPFPHVHYHFAARRMKVSPNNVLVARDVTLNIGDVPVLWLPFMVQSLAEGRRSGLLMPRFGLNDIARSSPRYNRRVEDIGFYWAVNDYMGSELALDWFSENWMSVRGSLDWNWQQRFLRGGATFRRYWRENGRREFTLSAQNSWRPDERTNMNLSANYATSSSFIAEQSYDPRELNRSIDSNLQVQRRFDWGSLSSGARRSQALHDGTVRYTLPTGGISLTPITLFRALPGDDSWYNNATFTGNASVNSELVSIGPENVSRTMQSRRESSGNFNASLNLGRFSVSQRFRLDDQIRRAREFAVDTIAPLPRRTLQRTEWGTSLSFQQRLFGTSTISPNLQIRGGTLRSDTTQGETVSQPVRMDFGASLRTDVFGFWPGVGPFEAFRHRVSPSFSYSYSPRPTVTDRQREVFAIGDIREQNRLTIGLNQTFEAKFRPRSEPDAARPTVAEPADEVDVLEPDTATGPRRRPQAERLSLLSISTDAVVYDFVAARHDGRGIQTTQISNALQSDLLRGMQVNFTHDLFRPIRDEEGVQTGDRAFAPHLSRVSAGFSLNNESWLFRQLGLGGREEQGSEPLPLPEEAEGGPAVDRTESEGGLIGTRRRTPALSPMQPVGTWNASFNYTMFRPRADAVGELESQLLMANFRFQPTAQWGVSWNTGYSFTSREFTDHVLTLTRTLHDWDANFDFVRAQNGNFSFMFRVALRANPDVKFDYSQRDRRGGDPVRAF